MVIWNFIIPDISVMNLILLQGTADLQILFCVEKLLIYFTLWFLNIGIILFKIILICFK